MRHLAAAAVGALAGPITALAQDYPTRSIRLVVMTAAGGLMDVAARVTAEYVGKALGQSIVIENRPGGGGNLGAEAIAKAPPNGYTIGLIQLGNVAINPYVYADMTFDPLNDLVPVAPVTSSAILVVANANVAANDLRELIALARRTPGKLSYGSGGQDGASSCGENVQGIGRRRHPPCALSRGRASRDNLCRRAYSAHVCRLGRGSWPGRGWPRQGLGVGSQYNGSRQFLSYQRRPRPACRGMIRHVVWNRRPERDVGAGDRHAGAAHSCHARRSGGPAQPGREWFGAAEKKSGAVRRSIRRDHERFRDIVKAARLEPE